MYIMCTVGPVLKGHPIGHKNMVSQDRWSLVTGSYCTEMQDSLPGARGPSRQVVDSQDGFHCTSDWPDRRPPSSVSVGSPDVMCWSCVWLVPSLFCISATTLATSSAEAGVTLLLPGRGYGEKRH